MTVLGRGMIFEPVLASLPYTQTCTKHAQERERERERETDRQTDRQTDRDRQTETERQTETRERERERERESVSSSSKNGTTVRQCGFTFGPAEASAIRSAERPCAWANEQHLKKKAALEMYGHMLAGSSLAMSEGTVANRYLYI